MNLPLPQTMSHNKATLLQAQFLLHKAHSLPPLPGSSIVALAIIVWCVMMEIKHY
jgi:hypothetical protein